MSTDVKIGDQVLTQINNVKVHGTVESIQLAKNLIDVKIYEPGNPSHCLIVARPPEQVTLASDDQEQSSTAAGQSGITEADIQSLVDLFTKKIEEIEARIAPMESLPSAISSFSSRVGSLETSVSSLSSRVAALEAAAKVPAAEPATETQATAAAAPIPAVKQ